MFRKSYREKLILPRMFRLKRHLLKSITIAVAIATIVVWHRVLEAFEPPALYKKDFIQFYLMAKAAVAGLPLYAPLVDLAHALDPNLTQYHQHPSAYPPTALIFIWPLAWLSYTSALVLWDVTEVVCFGVASTLIVKKLLSRTTLDRMLLVLVSCILWPPFYYDFYHGQVMMLILLLLTATWLSLTSGRNVLAGIFLGLLFALKLYGWPIAIFLILKRKFEPVVCAGIVFLLLNLIVAAWLGFAPLKQYLPVAREIESIYRTHPLNFSLLAQGTNWLGQWFGMLLLVMGLIVSLVLASRAPDFDHGFMIMIAATIILTPISWAHYMITLVPALCLIASWKDMQLGEKVLIALLFYLAVPEIYESFVPRPIIRIMPVLFVIGLMVLLSRSLVHSKTRPLANAPSEEQSVYSLVT